MNKPPKRHHIVPQFLLQRFAKDGIVELVDRSDLTKRRQSGVPTALAQNDFYTFNAETGPDTEVESVLFAKHIEGPASAALVKMIDEGRASTLPRLREALSYFLAFQYVRGEGMRHAIVENWRATFQQITLAMTPQILKAQIRKHESREPTDEEVQSLWEFGQDTSKYKIDVTNKVSAHLGQVLPMALELVPYFYGRRWMILEFEEPSLLTGDEPIALIGKTLLPGSNSGGLALSPEVVFATDPKHALVMVRPDLASSDARQRGTPRMAEIINRHIAFRCHRFVVQTPGIDAVSGLSLPKKGPPTQTVGAHVGFHPGLSVAGADEARRRVESRNAARRKPPNR